MIETCLCGKKGEFKVEHGFLCKLCYQKYLEEKLTRFLNKAGFINMNNKYVLVSDSNANPVQVLLLNKFFQKHKLVSYVVADSKEKSQDYFLYLQELANKFKGYVIMLPNTVDFECVMGLKFILKEFKLKNYFGSSFKIGKAEFIKPFYSIKDEELEQYARIKKIKYAKKIKIKNYEKYSGLIADLDKKYFIKRSFLNSIQEISKI